MANTSGRRKISEQQVDEIIRLRTEMMSEKNVAQVVGVAPNTVRKHWHAYLDEQAPIRAGNRERHRQEMTERYDEMAAEAWSRRDDPDGSKWGSVALKAMQLCSAINGYDAPTQIAVADTRTPEDARAMLAKLSPKERKRLGL